LDTIGLRLRTTRREKGVSQETLAAATGVAVTTIIRIEQGKSTPKLATIWKFAEALGVDPKHLAYGHGDAGDPDTEGSAEFYGRMAESFATNAREMLDTLRQLEDVEALSPKDRARIKKSIPKFERSAETFERSAETFERLRRKR
jgi:transcriptional regulator with XRE-family HTH domain